MVVTTADRIGTMVSLSDGRLVRVHLTSTDPSGRVVVSRYMDSRALGMIEHQSQGWMAQTATGLWGHPFLTREQAIEWLIVSDEKRVHKPGKAHSWH